jgi:hypothetical protein
LSDSANLQHSLLESVTEAHNHKAWLAGLALTHLGDDPIGVGAS